MKPFLDKVVSILTINRQKGDTVDPIPEVVPISELRTRQNELLNQLPDKPVVLTQHGRTVAVMVGPEPYNELLEHIEDLQLALDAVEARADEEPTTDLDDYLKERGEHVPASSDS